MSGEVFGRITTAEGKRSTRTTKPVPGRAERAHPDFQGLWNRNDTRPKAPLFGAITAGGSMTELTEAEIERLCAAYSETLGEPHGPRPHALLAAAAMLIDARLAPIRALAEKWDAEPWGGPFEELQHREGYDAALEKCTNTLRAALSADLTAPQPTSGTEAQDEGQ